MMKKHKQSYWMCFVLWLKVKKKENGLFLYLLKGNEKLVSSNIKKKMKEEHQKTWE